MEVGNPAAARLFTASEASQPAARSRSGGNLAPTPPRHYHDGTMTIRSTHLATLLGRRLLAGALLACLAMGAVPALAHCCADRCHDAEPPLITDDCHCTLRGVEPPVDALPLSTEPDAILAEPGRLVLPHLSPPPERLEVLAGAPAPLPAPGRTVVLLI